MHVASSDELFRETTRLWNDLPDRVLRYVGQMDRCHPLHLQRQVADWLVGDRQRESAERVTLILDWFETRGDISRGPKGVLRCLPHYAVGNLLDPAVDRIPLFGSPAAADQLRSLLRPAGGALICEPTADNIGLMRWIRLPPTQRPLLKERLNALGLRVFSPDEVTGGIEQVDALDLPDTHLFQPLPAIDGSWETYAPETPVNYQAGRWQAVDYWDDVELARWRPKDGYMGFQRFFLFEPPDQAFEISADLARWWQFLLDDRANRPTCWTYDWTCEVLTLNGPVPQSISRVLHFLSHRPPSRDRYSYYYSISPQQFETVRRLGEEHLHVRVQQKKPSTEARL